MPVLSHCAVEEPEQFSGKHRVVALLLHGFGSDKDEVCSFYGRLAEALRERAEVTSVRIDFRGYGQNHDEAFRTEDSTLETMVEDAAEAVQHIRREWGAVTSVVVVGFSLGALVGARLVLNHPIQAFVGLSPVDGGLADINRGLQEKEVQDILRCKTEEEVFNFDLGWRKISLRKGFFTSLATSPHTSELLKSFPENVFLVAGDQDWSHANIENIRDCRPDSVSTRILSLPKTDHIFNCFQDNEDQTSVVISAVVDFLAHLQLCLDR